MSQVNAERLTLEFGPEPMERHRTLIAIGMRDQAGFTADAQHAAEKARRRLVCSLAVCAGGHRGGF